MPVSNQTTGTRLSTATTYLTPSTNSGFPTWAPLPRLPDLREAPAPGDPQPSHISLSSTYSTTHVDSQINGPTTLNMPDQSSVPCQLPYVRNLVRDTVFRGLAHLQFTSRLLKTWLLSHTEANVDTRKDINPGKKLGNSVLNSYLWED